MNCWANRHMTARLASELAADLNLLVDAQRANDPITRFRTYLKGIGLWSDSDEKQLTDDCSLEVDQAVAQYLAMPPPPARSMFDYLYAELPASLRGQRDEIEEDEGHA